MSENQSPDFEQTNISKDSNWKNLFTTVTPLSKYLAMALFVALPFIGFWIGLNFQRDTSVVDYLDVVKIKATQEMSDNQGKKLQIPFLSQNTDVPPDWNLYKNEDFGFSFSYPSQWDVLQLEDYKDGKNYIFLNETGYPWRKSSPPLFLSVGEPPRYDTLISISYKDNAIYNLTLKDGDKSYSRLLADGTEVTVYEIKGVPVEGFNPELHGIPGDYDLLIVQHEGDLLEFRPKKGFDELSELIASTISFSTNKSENLNISINITKQDVVQYLNKLHKCSSLKEEWQCFDEDLNISVRVIGNNPRIYDMTEYREGRVFTEFSDITGDGYDDATVMVYFKNRDKEEFFRQTVYVLTRDISITDDPERDIFALYISQVGSTGQFDNGFTEIIPLESWENNKLYISGTNFKGSSGMIKYGTQDYLPCNELMWDEYSKSIKLERVNCK